MLQLEVLDFYFFLCQHRAEKVNLLILDCRYLIYLLLVEPNDRCAVLPSIGVIHGALLILVANQILLLEHGKVLVAQMLVFFFQIFELLGQVSQLLFQLVVYVPEGMDFFVLGLFFVFGCCIRSLDADERLEETGLVEQVDIAIVVLEKLQVLHFSHHGLVDFSSLPLQHRWICHSVQLLYSGLLFIISAIVESIRIEMS